MNKLIILLFTGFLATSTQADVQITTIDSWRIVNAGSHTLLVNKFSEDPKSHNGFMFQMSRPHCLCEQPTFVMYNPTDTEGFVRPAEDARIRGQMRVDFKKWREVELEVFLALKPNRNVVRLRGTFSSLRDAKVIELNSPYGSDKWVLENIQDAMKQATKICESFIPYIISEETESKDMKT